MKKTKRDLFFILFPIPIPTPQHPHIWRDNNMMTGCKPQKAPSLDTAFSGTLLLDFPTFSTVRTKCLLFKPPSLWYSLIVAQTDQDMLILCSTHWTREWIEQKRHSFCLVAYIMFERESSNTQGNKQAHMIMHVDKRNFQHRRLWKRIRNRWIYTWGVSLWRL